MIKLFTLQWRQSSSNPWITVGKVPFEIVEVDSYTPGTGVAPFTLQSILGIDSYKATWLLIDNTSPVRDTLLYNAMNVIVGEIEHYETGYSVTTNESVRLVNELGYYLRRSGDGIGGSSAWDLYDDNDTSLGFSVEVPVTGGRISGAASNKTLNILLTTSPITDTSISTYHTQITVEGNNTTVTYTGYDKKSAARTWSSALINFYLNGETPVEPNTDPYSPGGTSGPGGGDGTFDFTSTAIGWAGLPTISACDTGMIDIYIPSASQLQALSSYLWAGSFDPDNFLKLVADPMDVIIGMSIIPLTATEIGTSAATLAVGNISTGLLMPKATRQYVEVDCGSVSILPKWGAYLDFSPYSKLQLFLPYIGYVDISPDDCMNGTIAVKYSIDILAGVCVAQVMCYDAGTPNGHVLYELAGNCSVACPITAGQYQNIALAALRSIGSIAGMTTSTPAGIAAGIEDVANSVISCAKPDVKRSGGFGGSSGLMGHQIPYLILTIPKMCRPEHQNEFIGYPSFVEIQLSTISGYTEIESVHLQGIPGACDDDISEIEMLLKGGIIL